MYRPMEGLMTSTANLPDISSTSENLASSLLTPAVPSPPPSPTKSKLLLTPNVADIVAQNGSIDIRLFVVSIWKYRTNGPFTAELCHRLCSMPISQPTLDQVEFYLPQFAHMLVHLEHELPLDNIEHFVLLLAQKCIHFALQFFWTIYAALDENRPKRAGNHPHTFARCARLLLLLEQCFVYGSPASRQASELHTQQSISKDEMEQILMADRRFFAAQQGRTDAICADRAGKIIAPLAGGWLLKKGGGTRTMGRRNWTMRWCRLEQRILLVFNKPTDTRPRAAIPLQGAQLHVVENKRPFYLEITHNFSETKAKFSANTADDLSTWVAYLQKAAVLPDPPAGSPSKGSHTLERTLARMSFVLQTFIRQSSSSSAPLAVQKTTAFSSRSSPFKPGCVKCAAAATASATIGQKQSRILQSGSASACSTQVEDMDGRHVSTIDFGCDTDALLQALMTPDQQRRYEFFCTMVHFVKSITDISEALRRVEPASRKELLGPLLKRLQIPSRAYIPLCKSTDPYCNVSSVFSNEGRVFSTHERAPCLIYVGTEENENSKDISSVLFSELYETRATGSLEDAATVDKHITTSMRKSPRVASRPCQMSPFLRQLLSASTQQWSCNWSALIEGLIHVEQDEPRKARIEKVFGELTFTKAARLYQSAPCANPKRWRLTSLLSKSYDDLRQEVLVMQFIAYFQHIFDEEKLLLRLHPYRILSTGSSTGLLEVVPNAMSLDGIKKTHGFTTLRCHFEQLYGDDTKLLCQAQQNFMHSLAAYSIVCYIFAIKDRHNGNIMLDIEGFLIHIDFGFFLGRAPGGSFSLETAPFKLTAEMVDVLGGRDSTNFEYFTDLCVQGALVARKHGETILTLVEMMSYHSRLSCFTAGTASPLAGLKDRLFLNMPENKVRPIIQSMVQRSYDHFGTTKYDQFQTFSNGIAK